MTSRTLLGFSAHHNASQLVIIIQYGQATFSPSTAPIHQASSQFARLSDFSALSPPPFPLSHASPQKLSKGASFALSSRGSRALSATYTKIHTRSDGKSPYNLPESHQANMGTFPTGSPFVRRAT